MLAETGDPLHGAERRRWASPSVILLVRYVRAPRRHARRRSAAAACCAATSTAARTAARSAATVDHVLPRSRGGADTWENLVACCLRCNGAKGDRTPAEMGWRLRCARTRRPGPAWALRGTDSVDPRWEEFLAA